MMIIISLDFHSTKKGPSVIDSWSRGTESIQMYPHRDTSEQLFPTCIRNIVARDQSKKKRRVTEGGKKHCKSSFS